MVGRKSSERKTFPSKLSTLSKLEDIRWRERCGTALYRIYLGFQTHTLQDQEMVWGQRVPRLRDDTPPDPSWSSDLQSGIGSRFLFVLNQQKPTKTNTNPHPISSQPWEEEEGIRST